MKFSVKFRKRLVLRPITYARVDSWIMTQKICLKRTFIITLARIGTQKTEFLLKPLFEHLEQRVFVNILLKFEFLNLIKLRILYFKGWGFMAQISFVSFYIWGIQMGLVFVFLYLHFILLNSLSIVTDADLWSLNSFWRGVVFLFIED